MARWLKPQQLRLVSVTSEGLCSETLLCFLGRGGVGFVNPGIGNHGSVVKVVQFLQKYLTYYNSQAHGYERPVYFMISGYHGWFGIDSILINY